MITKAEIVGCAFWVPDDEREAGGAAIKGYLEDDPRSLTEPVDILNGRLLIYPDGRLKMTGLDIAPMGYLKPPWRVRLKKRFWRLRRFWMLRFW